MSKRKTPTEALIEYLESHTDEEIIAEIEKRADEIREQWKGIPEDGDCSICPYSHCGECGGMVTPCFDICPTHQGLYEMEAVDVKA